MSTEIRKRKERARVITQSEIAPEIFDLQLESTFAEEARPGQFVGVYPAGDDLLLPRPISICGAENGILRLTYRVSGAGTARMAGLQKGDSVGLIGVLGNGFPLEEADGKHILLIGGGIGIPPVRFLMQALSGRADTHKDALTAVLGYRDGDTFLAEECAAFGKTVIATESGEKGIKGNALTAVREKGLTAEVLFACGPKPMLQAVQSFARENGIRAFLSLEERMACGVGVCLGCVCETVEKDAHSMVKNARVCTEGPVFDAAYVRL